MKFLACFSRTFSSSSSASPKRFPTRTYVLTPKQWLKNKWNFQQMKWFDEKLNEEKFSKDAEKV
jgi:hypothetical protein